MAASSEVFGTPDEFPQTESTPFIPLNPYGCAKAFAANLCRVYRDAHQLFICCGIAYNHESPRRSESFVTRKITATAARINQGSDEVLELGNLDAARDWGYAPEYVEAMWKMLQQPVADDYILATGTSTTVREFATAAFAAYEMDLQFEGIGTHEIARERRSGNIRLRVNPKFYRPVDPAQLVGDSAKARHNLNWKPLILGIAVAESMAKAEVLSNNMPHSVQM
jgi:GDPmannose 4,6-dehydratase